ncbi:MAG: hypothetical protein UU22_C0019G0004 [Parcubacteria group bacterium GW2011_GWA2_40_8]|nr:MAG: hypothetical protein UU22_C0019G0004 [Parcubacteria group bacterium GW2011_GWA2_40_8]
MTKVLNRFSALNPMRRQGGFTLIELLVVIAIIAVLAAVVLVALGNARTRARDARRVSDLNNVALALEVYLDTTNVATYPTAGVAAPSNAQWATMVTSLRGANVIQGTIEDPINTAEMLYRAQTNLANANGTGAAVDTSYLIGADLETTSTASCASDYDGPNIGTVAVGATDCSENAASDCAGDDTQELDYCICNGPACE